MTREELIYQLSDIRAQYSIFDEKEEPKYRALSEVIKLINTGNGDMISRSQILQVIEDRQFEHEMTYDAGKDYEETKWERLLYADDIKNLIFAMPAAPKPTECEAVIDKIRAEIVNKAESGQWSEAVKYGMLKAILIIDKYKAESEVSE